MKLRVFAVASTMNEISTPGNELVNIAIGGLITQTIEVDAEPVFDSLGSVVFSNDRSTLEDC